MSTGKSAMTVLSDSARRASSRHLLAVAWFGVIALLALTPALMHGTQFGSFDLLNQFGVLRQHGLVVHNSQAGDQSDSMIPWATLSWMQVHQGHLPLWNPYSALGTPLAFSWQPASFSLPSLIGYLAPLSWAFTVQVLVTLVIAGSGVYALGRVMGLSTLACVLGGTVFELSGPMLGWLGWPQASALSWAGWLFAAALLILKGRTDVLHIAGLALVIAAMIYAGHPEVLTLFGISLLVFVLVVLTRQIAVSRGVGAVRRPLLGLSVGVIAGAALGAPLLLPGLQLLTKSIHSAPGVNPAELVKGNPPLPAHNLVHLLLQGYDGLPIAGSHWFGYVGGYSETAAYLGIIPLVLAVAAVATRGRRPEVLALTTVAVVMVIVAFVPAVVDGLSHLPLLGSLIWQRALMPLVFALSVLSGFGMDSLVRNPERLVIRRWLAGGFGAALLLLAGLFLFGRNGLTPADARIRETSFVWAAAEIGVGLVVVGALFWAARFRRTASAPDGSRRARLGRWTGASLLVCEAAFLITAGGSLWTASSTPFAPTPSTISLKRAVGSAIVGYGAPLCFFPPGLGIPANAQDAYGIQELAAYDPILPSSYFTSWKQLTGETGGNRSLSTFCPVITTIGQARLYGVGFVLEPAGSPGPRGAPLYARVGGEDLYRIPGAAAATLSPRSMGGSSTRSIPVTVVHPDPATWSMVTEGSGAQVLRLRLTDVPGWHATVDGHPVPLTRWAGVMLQTDVPAGRHKVVLSYWPATFTLGLALAAVATIGLFAAYVLERIRGRRPSRSGGPGRFNTDLNPDLDGAPP